jgi:D-alanyl-D-alanine dipeptidase
MHLLNFQLSKKMGLTPSVFFFFLLNILAQKSDYDTEKWTELNSLDNTIQLDMRYATDNNFVKAKMYDCGRCFFRPEAAKALAKAHKLLKDKGLGGLKMFDCYRPRPYQQRLWNKKPDSRYVTPPWKGSQHTRYGYTLRYVLRKSAFRLSRFAQKRVRKSQNP